MITKYLSYTYKQSGWIINKYSCIPAISWKRNYSTNGFKSTANNHAHNTRNTINGLHQQTRHGTNWQLYIKEFNEINEMFSFSLLSTLSLTERCQVDAIANLPMLRTVPEESYKIMRSLKISFMQFFFCNTTNGM